MTEQELLQRIMVNPQIFGGKPIIRGRRLAVEHVLGMLAAGDSPETILEGYPWLEAEDIRACLVYARRHVTQQRKAKRRFWQPRFSLRTLAIFVTLVGAYFGAWVPTEKFASMQRPGIILQDGRELSERDDNFHKISSDILDELSEQQSSVVCTTIVTSPAPLILARREKTFDFKVYKEVDDKRCYYLWIFGPKIKLPFESLWHQLSDEKEKIIEPAPTMSASSG